jgi:ketol-acid reductoisomerase
MKLSNKLSKCNDSLTVNMYDNGFMVEIGGRDSNDDWKNAKIMCPTLEEVFDVIREASEMERE